VAKPKPSLLHDHRGWVPAALFVLAAAGALAMRWWLRPR
jgi:hypothetical protein